MADSILVPQVGQDLTEAKVVALHVKLGDQVKKGQVVAEVESEKASFEVEAFAAGTVIDLRYQVGDTATVLQPLMVLGMPGEAAKSGTAGAPAAQPAPAIPGGAAKAAPAVAPVVSGGRSLRSSPLARRVAALNGVDLARVSGSGPNGAVVFRDVKAAIGGQGARAAAAGGAALNLRSLRDGSGDPAVFIHGFGAELAAWRPLVGNISGNNTLLGLDLPAHGASPEQALSGFDQLVDHVAAALSAAGRTRLHLIGHSLGAAVAAALAARGGLDVRSLTLISPGGLGAKINGDFIAGYLEAKTEGALKAWMQSLVHDPASLPGAMVRATLAAREGTDLAGAQGRLARAVFAGSTQLFSVRDKLKQFQGPTRVIVGRDDAIIPAEHAENLPGHVAVHRLSQVGHLPFLEAGPLVGRLVAETIRAAG
jgi:pyruvate dehydrogenase E2 component (dihydrolipoamide acetyltransferase)